MPTPARKLSPALGFLVGLLVMVVPLTIYFVTRGPKDRAEDGKPTASRAAGRASERAASTAPSPATRGAATGPWEIDETAVTPAGASLPAAEPLPSRAEIATSLARVETWLRRHEIDPYGGATIDSLRLFGLEVECWHRLALAATGTGRQEALRSEVRRRLQRFADGPLRDRLAAAPSGAGLIETLVLLQRARQYDVDVTGATAAVEAVAFVLSDLMNRLPPATAALYAAQLGTLPVARDGAGARILASPELSIRPREASSRPAEVGALTQEILARTDMAQRRLEGIDAPSRAYLARALPHFALAATLLQNLEQAGDLASCLAVADLTRTHGYHEAIRFLLRTQDSSGSFGPVGMTPWAVRLAFTSSCVTALSLVPSGGAG